MGIYAGARGPLGSRRVAVWSENGMANAPWFAPGQGPGGAFVLSVPIDPARGSTLAGGRATRASKGQGIDKRRVFL